MIAIILSRASWLLFTALNHDISVAVTAVYQNLDAQIASFQTATGLHCPEGCGQCCENPEIEATPLEMLPLAAELLRRGDARQWLDKAHRADHSGQCVFYRPDPLISGHGRCHLYLWRPVLCCLFGFAALPDKQGVPRLAICRQHKATMPETVAMSQVAIADGLPVVQFMGPLRVP